MLNESKTLLTGWRHHFLWNGCWCAAKGHISTISVDNLPRLHALDVDRFNERSWLYTGKARSRWYLVQTIRDADYADDRVPLANTSAQLESLHSLKQAAGGISFHFNTREYMCFNPGGYISTLNGRFLKLVDKFTYLWSSLSSTKNDINMQLAMACTASDRWYGSQNYPIK